MFTDLRFALRQLWKNPGFTAVAVLALALGIGANTAIFSVVNAVLLKPLPFPEPEQLVAVGALDTRESSNSTDLNSLCYPDFFDFRDQNKSFAFLATYRDRGFALVDEREAKSVRGQTVSAEFLDVLGVKPVLGRNFTREDEKAGGGPGGQKVILGHAFWEREFKSDPQALGKTLILDRVPYTVIGVLPAGFQFPIQTESVDLYATFAEEAVALDGGKPTTEQRGNHSIRGIGRLKPGVTPVQASLDLRAIASALEKEYPDSNSHFSAGTIPLRDELVGDLRTALYVLFGAVACVLLIASANVANLLLARASVRGKEMALRSALGAGRGRIIRQLLTESVLLAGLGGVLGLLLAHWGTTALIAVVPENIPRSSTIQLDGVVLAFTLVVALGTGVIFGLAPAVQASKVDLNGALKAGGRGAIGGGRSHLLRNSLVVAEVSLALMLLIAAGLLIQSFDKLSQVKSGLQTERLLTARIGLADAAYPTAEKIAAFYNELLLRLRAIPGVQSVSTIFPLPLSGSNSTTTFDVEEHPLPEGQQAASPVRIAATDYFKTMGIPMIRGRVFEPTDSLKATPVVIVNERFVEKFFPNQDVIGKRIKPGWSADEGEPRMREIIGVVGNVKYGKLSADFSPEMYLPAAQIPMDVATLTIRTNVTNPAGVTTAVAAELAKLDRNIPLTRVRVFEEYVKGALARPRFNAMLLTIFAGVALLLTAIGIYGVMAYSVAQRTSEIGVRMALGAGQSSIFRLVVGQAMTLVAFSIVLGLAGAFAATRLMNSMLFGVSAGDPVTFAVLAAIIAVVAFLAAWLPARRATRVDPVVALRAE